MAWLSAAGCTGGGERDWVAKAFVSPDGEAELYSGTIGRWGVSGKVRLTYSGKSWEVDAIGFEG